MQAFTCIEIGIDIGGTAIKIGIFHKNALGEKILFKKKLVDNKYRSNPDALCISIAQVINEYAKQFHINSIGISIPGVVENGVVYNSCNLEVDEYPIALKITELTGFTAKCANDADTALIGEITSGALKNRSVHHAVMLTLGTGVGGALYLDNKIYKGKWGAGEIGHMIIIEGGKPCSCGSFGCYEQYASASALISQIKENPLLKKSLIFTLCEGNTNKIDGKIFFEACKQEDKCAQFILDRYTDYVVLGIRNLIQILSPEVIIIGGGISSEGNFLLLPIKQKLANTGYDLEITTATLKNEAGMYGAVNL